MTESRTALEFLMRYTPAALALSLLAGVTASVSYSAPPEPLGPRAAALVSHGALELANGRTESAIDAQGLQGKALHYYREALERDPQNLAAISGEGAALVEKGAVAKARRNLVRLQGLCGNDCAETRELAAIIARGPAERIVTVDAVRSAPVVSAN